MEPVQLTISPFDFTDKAYADLTAVHNAIWPDARSTIAEFKRGDRERNPDYYWQRISLEDGDRLLASAFYCETWWARRPGRYYINISVWPEQQRRGYGTLLFHFIMRELAQRPLFTTITADSREDMASGLRFLDRMGFQQMMRFPRSFLDVASYDPDKFVATEQAAQAAGYQLKTLIELKADDPDYLRKLWELEKAITPDIPFPEPVTPMPWEDFQKMIANPNLVPEAFIVAVTSENTYVGMSTLWASQADRDKYYNGLTGVLRPHRRQKLATAMKNRALAAAKNNNIRLIETDNEENNPMYDLNMQLGFKPEPALLDFERKIESADLVRYWN
jgi:GNAT superfamily N-acetyltransferase